MLLALLRSHYAGRIGFGKLKYNELGAMGENSSVIDDQNEGDISERKETLALGDNGRCTQSED